MGKEDEKPCVTGNYEDDFKTAVELRMKGDWWYEIFLNNMVRKHNVDFFEVKNKIDSYVNLEPLHNLE